MPYKFLKLPNSGTKGLRGEENIGGGLAKVQATRSCHKTLKALNRRKLSIIKHRRTICTRITNSRIHAETP